MTDSGSSSIKMGKAEALMRYRRLRNGANMWRILEVSLALLLVSRWLPAAAKLGLHCLLHASDYLYNPHINFLIGNAIIVVLVLLSRQTNSATITTSGSDKSFGGSTVGFGIDEVDRENVFISDFGPAISPAAVEEKRIIVLENAGDDLVIVKALEEAKDQLRRFRRTQSEKQRRDLRVKPELVRSETEMNPRAAASALIAACKKKSKSADFTPVDTLSSDEFRKTVEDFIEKHRRNLSDQKVTGANINLRIKP